MKFKSILGALFALVLSCTQVLAQATILPPGMTCFQATTGLNGMVGVIGPITGGSLYTSGSYGGVPLTGGSGTNATANITVSGGAVTAVTILNPGINYVVGDVLSAAAANIGGTGSGFSVPVSSTSINSGLAGGSVAFYVGPGPGTFKQTWQNAGQTILNQNPVPLDQNGCAVIYGAGIYLMVVADSLGNTVYSQLTASTSPQGIFFAGLAGGTGNAITITDAGFALQDGATIQFRAIASNTGPATIAVSGGPPIPIVIDTQSGPAALSGSEIDAANMPIVSYDATNVEFHLVNPAEATSSSGGSGTLTPPQGYLNLVGQASGDVIQTGDVSGAATIFYSPYVGNTIPIWNGSVFKTVTFSETTATLTSSGSPANTIQDLCVFSNNGVPTLAIGPSWTTVTAGSGNRGSGPGSAQIVRLNGLWVNANSITGYNGLSSFAISANQCTYVGSVYVDATAGQVSAFVTYGQSRKWGIWNAYNRVPIVVQAGDPTASWTSAPTTWRESRGQTTNFITSFTGLPEETVQATFNQTLEQTNTANANIGIGINSTTSPTGLRGSLTGPGTGNPNSMINANATLAPVLGINNFNMIEQAPTGTTANEFFGGNLNMLLQLSWRG